MRPSLLTVTVGGLVLASAFLSSPSARAQPPSASTTITLPPAGHFAGPWRAEKLTAEEVEKLVGPIALYPDPLLAQVLPASTYPLDIVRAARLVRQGAAETALAAADLDASVQAVARQPEVLFMMDEYLDWTERLGQAFIEQPDDVMRMVQHLRIIAREFGNLATTTQQEVIIEQESVRIVPVTEYVYVPYYEPSIVYYRPCPTTYSFVSYRSCGYVGPWYDLDCDWQRRVVCRRDGWSWRRYCERRCSSPGLTIRVNLFDDDDCRRPVHDWRRDDRRHAHRRDSQRDDGRRGWDRAPRAAEPLPPTITAPSPTPTRPPRERPTPRPDRPRDPDQAAPPAAPEPTPQPAPEPPATRPERTPRSAEPAMKPITRPNPDTPPTARPSKPDKPAARDRKPDRPVEARRSPPSRAPTPTPTLPPPTDAAPGPVSPPTTAPTPTPDPTPAPAPKPRPIRSAEPRPPVVTAPPPEVRPRPKTDAPPRIAPAPPTPTPTSPPAETRPPRRAESPAPEPKRPIIAPGTKSAAPPPAARPTPKPDRPAAQRPAERPPVTKAPSNAREDRKPAQPTSPSERRRVEKARTSS